jgi:hypothetical protein
MSAPTLDRPSGSQTGTSTGQPRRHNRLVLVASVLLVAAIAVGASLAVATRPDTSRAPAAAAAQQPAVQQPAVQQDQGAAAQPGSASDPAAVGVTTPALEDGDHDAYITKVDQANHRVVVDVVQVFHDNQAVQAAVADGKSPAEAKYLTTWVRNQNPRLRTLPLAGDLQLNLRGGCESPASHQLALLAADARAMSGSVRTFYFTLTVAGGQVHRIQERVAINAC